VAQGACPEGRQFKEKAASPSTLRLTVDTRKGICSQRAPCCFTPRAVSGCVLAAAGKVACPVECGAGAGGVDLLGVVLGRGAERGVVGDAVAVAVGGDGAREALPTRRGLDVLRWSAACFRPALACGERGVEQAVARVSMRRRSVSARRNSSLMGPVASGMSPAIRRGVFRVRPDPEGRAVARATR